MKNELIDLATIKKKRQRELNPSRNGLEQYGQNIRDWLFEDSKIAIRSGKRSVFELKAGDLVLTRDRGFQPLESIEKLDTDQIENGNISVLPVQWNKSGEKPTTGSDQDHISVSRSQAYRLACSQGEMIMCDDVWVGSESIKPLKFKKRRHHLLLPSTALSHNRIRSNQSAFDFKTCFLTYSLRTHRDT